MGDYAPAVRRGIFSRRYRLRSKWELQAPVLDVFDALSRPIDYPKWWPQFRDVRRIDDLRYWMVVRAFLPYYLTYLMEAEIADSARGVLQARTDGDIVGRIRWQIDAGSRGTVAYLEERVEMQVDLLNLVAPVARVAFETNHRLMMRDGLLGLRAYLADRTPAEESERVRRWRHEL